jgi:hypothetical protein
MQSALPDAAGHRRSPTTMPGYHQGRPPQNKGEQHPADPPTTADRSSTLDRGDRATPQGPIRVTAAHGRHPPSPVSGRSPLRSRAARWQTGRRDRGGQFHERCDTGATLGLVPTNRRRHAITETPPVEAALEELRRELGTDRIELSELVVLGAQVKLQNLRAARGNETERRRKLADRVRARRVGVDLDAASSVRASGWRH